MGTLCGAPSRASPGTRTPLSWTLLGWSLRTLLVNLLDDIPDTWPILVVSTWEGKPGNASHGEGGGALGDDHGVGLGMRGSHGTIDGGATASDLERLCGGFSS